MLLLSMIIAAIQVSTSSAQSLMNKAERDEIVIVSKNDPGMAAAMQKARDSLDGFLKLAATPPAGASGFSVKVAIRDGNDAEYFWITPFTPKGENFTGKLNNSPRNVRRSLKMGDTLNFTKAEIVDWMYIDKAGMKGNYTACALMKSPKDRAAFKHASGLIAIVDRVIRCWDESPYFFARCRSHSLTSRGCRAEAQRRRQGLDRYLREHACHREQGEAESLAHLLRLHARDDR